MSQIMEYFNSEMRTFTDECEKLLMQVEFHEGTYPPRITIRGAEVWGQTAMEGMEPETKRKTPTITVIGSVETAVAVKDFAAGKKDLTKLVGRAEKMLQLYLHAFVEEKLEAER